MHTYTIEPIKTITKDENYNWLSEESRIEKIYGNKNISNIIDALKDQFDKSKITYIVGDFSGGHDEGGFDEIKFTDKNDNEIKPESLKTHWVNQYKLFKHDNKKQIAYFSQEYATSVDLNDASQLESLMWQTGALNQFGSFAGEYSVNGSVKLDLNTKKYILDGSQTIEEYDELYEEGEVA